MPVGYPGDPLLLTEQLRPAATEWVAQEGDGRSREIIFIVCL